MSETRMDRIARERTEARRASASICAASVLQELAFSGIRVKLIGSLANGQFSGHSDIDFLVETPIMTPEQRAIVERTVAGCMRRSGLPYDLVYSSDLTPDRLAEFIS